MNIMLERTDDEHLLNASQLCRILENEYGICTDRRTIYSEMEILAKFGLDIQQKKGKRPGYYIEPEILNFRVKASGGCGAVFQIYYREEIKRTDTEIGKALLQSGCGNAFQIRFYCEPPEDGK